MSTPVYDRDYFIAKFDAIPDDKWRGGMMRDGTGRCCAMGHCGAVTMDTALPIEAAALIEVLRPVFEPHWTGRDHWQLASINDGSHSVYNQSTPKARILAALRDLPAAANTGGAHVAR